MDTGLQKLIEAAGTRHALAKRLKNAWKSAVYKWKVVPAEHVLNAEEQFGVSRYVMRPDIYGPDPGGAVNQIVTSCNNPKTRVAL